MYAETIEICVNALPRAVFISTETKKIEALQEKRVNALPRAVFISTQKMGA